MTVSAPVPDRVVQVRTPHGFGTGYLVGPRLVLTAAHVVGASDASVTVGRPGDEGMPASGTVTWYRRDEWVDAALVTLAGPVPALVGLTRGGPATRFGIFATARPRQPVDAIGFPRLQRSPELRDQEHFAGELSPATGALGRRYELTSATPLPAPPADQTKTPWAGMSGAAVFSQGLLVGVVRQDRLAPVGTRLTATPASALVAEAAFWTAVAADTGWDPAAEPVELAAVLQPAYPNRDIRSVASLLCADVEAVRFHGRQAECDRLAGWCDGPEQLSVLVVTGQGGEGKTRLARWLVDRQRRAGWTAGLLQPAADDEYGPLPATAERLEPVAQVRGPLLAAVDYAETRPGTVRALLRYARAATGPVRILLLARARGEWCEALDEPDAGVRELLARAPDYPLTTLDAASRDWDVLFGDALHDLGRLLPTVPAYGGSDWPAVARRLTAPPAETDVRPTTVLGVQMSALTLLLRHGTAEPVTAAWPAERTEPAERTLLRHEEAYWTRVAVRNGLGVLAPAARRSAVAALSLVRAGDATQAAKIVNRLGIADPDRGRTARWLHELYPPPGDAYWGAVQPDRVAEFLVVAACTEDGELLPRLVTGAGDREQVRTLLRAVIAARSQAHFGNPVRPLLERIEHTAGLPVISAETLAWAVQNAWTLPLPGKRHDIEEQPDGSHVITGIMDPAVAALTVAGHRRGAHGMVKHDRRDAGMRYKILSLTLSQLGRDTEALEASAQAVACLRSDAAYRSDLVVELGRYAELLVRLGRTDEAVAAIEEETQLAGPLDQSADRGRLLTHASTLDLLVGRLVEDGRAADAIRYAAWHVAVVRVLAHGAELSEQGLVLVRALGRYAELLRDAARPAEALAAYDDADAVVSELASADVAVAPNDRAKLLDGRAHCLSELDDKRAAAAAWLASAGIWRGLPESDPDGPFDRVIGCLHNAAGCQAALGDLAGAATIEAEAADLADRSQTLRHTRPERYWGVQATCVSYLAEAGHLDQALNIAGRLARRADPGEAPLLAGLASLLHQIAERASANGNLAEAIQADMQAADILRALATGEDIAVVALLADVLMALTVALANCERYAEGADAASEAARLWLQVAAVEPRALANVGLARTNQGACLRKTGRVAEAAQAFADAEPVLRQADQRGALANTLMQHAECRWHLHELAEGVRLRREEVALRRMLAQSDPAQLTQLISSWVELGDWLLEKAHPREALAELSDVIALVDLVHGGTPHRYEPEHARALILAGMCLTELGQPAEAVEPYVRGFVMAVDARDQTKADAAFTMLSRIARAHPEAVTAQWSRLTGNDLPNSLRALIGNGS